MKIILGQQGFTALLALLLPTCGLTLDAPNAPQGQVNETRVLAESSLGVNWLVKGGGFAQQHFSPLRAINDKNVGALGFAWKTELPTPLGLAAEPIVVDGVIYLSAPLSVVYAIDAVSGRIIWRFDPKIRLDMSAASSYAARVNRGVAVWEGRVYVATGDCRLFAIDAAKGARIWDSPICDPRQTGSTGAPRVAKGKVFIGYNGSDDQIRGSIVAFDAATGKQAWRFWTVPGDPANGFESKALEMAAKTWSGKEWWWHGGGDVWDPITFDATTGLLLFGTATAHGLDDGTGRPTAQGAKLFAGCIVAVNAETGDYAWHFQTSTPARQTENFHIVLADLAIQGQKRHVAMTVPRNGIFYVLDARTGSVISGKPIIPQGPQVPGAVPTNDDWMEGVEGCTAGCWSVRNWWPMSYSPLTGLTYVPVMDRRPGDPGPAATPYFGKLIGWDVRSRSIRWAAEQPIAINSGVLSTAGNLVFQGEGTGEFAAYAADSGKKLWSFKTGSAIDSVPVTFSVHDEQYVVVPVGWGSASRFFGPARLMVTNESKRGPSRLLAFKMGSTNPFPYPKTTAPAVPKPPPQTADQQAVQRGGQLADAQGCTGCHSPELDGSGAWTEGGGIPDLRYMPKSAHQQWYAIVLGGSHQAQGMMGFGIAHPFVETKPLTTAEADDIHAYVIAESWKAYRAQETSRSAR